ncbi:LysR substrate-binding domain-containing protein [Methylobacterium sp. NEAU 140]|uniref:LysR substrate-binding domain-containing protein n=1 Tax=Methylobacterium sp. NEAU 140 TaxID=3064945 RepID=UPI00273599FC|nr:LysR substrate-binding domain-containing protein [Methylobacterium sp. NEAU 140]MDP4021969.1 LysR substrate-binding domain-containing protein [Methylobacterium sp. NEAU 140]
MSELDPATLMGRVKFRQLRLVDALARVGTLGRAAAALNVTQPAATKTLQDLEALLGVRLFERTPRAMVPTEIGAHVADYARRVLADGERFADGLISLKRGGYGALALGAIMATASDLLPRAVAALKQQRPLMTIRLLAATSDVLAAALARGEIELFLGRIPAPGDRAAFAFEPLAGEELWVFADASHPLAGRSRIDPAELGGLPWVLQPASSPMRRRIATAFASAGLAIPDNRVETTSIFATLNLVRRAGMVSMLPSTIIAHEVARGDFVRLPAQIAVEVGDFGVVTRPDRPLSANAHAFIAVVRALVRDGPPRS